MAIRQPKIRARTSTAKRKPLSREAVESAERDAVRQIANRSHRDLLRSHLDHAEAWLGTQRMLFGDSSEALVRAMKAATLRADYEWRCYGDLMRGSDRWRECAETDDVDKETKRILLDRGASAYQVALLDVRTAKVVNSKERKAADRAKVARREALVAELENEPGFGVHTVVVPWGASGTPTEITIGPYPIEQWRDETAARIARLSLDAKSSSGKRKKRRG